MSQGSPQSAPFPRFCAPYAPPDEVIARDWLSQPVAPAADSRIDALATRLIEAIRSHSGGLGGIEAAMSYGLTTLGVDSGTAVSSVLLYRIVTYWLPIPFGWVSINYLSKIDAI